MFSSKMTRRWVLGKERSIVAMGQEFRRKEISEEKSSKTPGANVAVKY